MAINFPDSPTPDEEFTAGGKTWIYLNDVWVLVGVIATSLAGGAAGKVPYQSGSGTTVFTDVGQAGQLLTSNGTSAPTWQAAPESGFNAFLLSCM
jgi:hypothetical protein